MIASEAAILAVIDAARKGVRQTGLEGADTEVMAALATRVVVLETATSAGMLRLKPPKETR